MKPKSRSIQIAPDDLEALKHLSKFSHLPMRALIHHALEYLGILPKTLLNNFFDVWEIEKTQDNFKKHLERETSNEK